MNEKISGIKKISGQVDVPTDKSITHRAILLSSLAKGPSTIENPLEAEDCLSTAACVESLGCKVNKKGNLWQVEGKGLLGYNKPSQPLNCGNSGTTMRLISGILAAQKFSSELIGDESLSKRPMQRVADPLSHMGANISLKEGKFAPIQIEASDSLKPVTWRNAVASAQVKSSVLLAALHVKGKTTYVEPTLSRDHSERMLKSVGVEINQEGSTVTIEGPADIKPAAWIVPKDFSSAAFFIVAGLMVDQSNICLKQVNLNPTRTGLLDVLNNAGAGIKIENKKEQGGELVGDILINGKAELSAFNVNEEMAPRLIDEVPILAVMATQAKGKSSLRGLAELRIKETDRVRAIAKNLSAMGAQVQEMRDGLIIDGPTSLKGAEVDSFGDHRIAMAFAVAGLAASGETTIVGSDSVSISFPTFWTELKKICHS